MLTSSDASLVVGEQHFGVCGVDSCEVRRNSERYLSSPFLLCSASSLPLLLRVSYSSLGSNFVWSTQRNALPQPCAFGGAVRVSQYVYMVCGFDGSTNAVSADVRTNKQVSLSADDVMLRHRSCVLKFSIPLLCLLWTSL